MAAVPILQSHLRRRRFAPAAVVVALHLFVFGALLTQRSMPLSPRAAEALTVVDLQPPRPVPPPPERPKDAPRQGKAQPPKLKALATDLLAATPVLPPPAPPLIASPIPELGTAPSPGAADIDGPGTGGGGSGDASGNGDGEDGDGGGTHSQWRSGRIKDSDYPRGPLEAGIGGTTVARVIVGVSGRVDDCIVTRSSGNAELDDATCRVIRQRYRYRPGRDAQGRPVSDEWVEERTWTSDGRSGGDVRP